MLGGFGFCCWWKINASHPMHAVIRLFAKTYGTPTFSPHITIRSNLDFIPTELKYPARYDTIEYVPSSIHASSIFIPSWKKYFYALELPVKGTQDLPRDAHVSLAYRFDRPFNSSEIKQAMQWVLGMTPLYYHDLECGVFDCHSSDLETWKNVIE